MMKSALRGNIRPFEVMEAFREASILEAQGKHIVHLSLGQPGKTVPQPVLDRVTSHMQRTSLGYTDACGLPALRERISTYYQERYDLDIPKERIFITVGSSAAYLLSLLAAFDTGATIGIAHPCYPAYPNMMKSLGIKPLRVKANEANGFQPTPATLKEAGAMDGLVIASPSNPTGSILSPEELHALSEYCHEQQIQLISDEIYHQVVYEDTPYDTALRYNDQVIILNSFSKYFLLPGWRLGWAVMPKYLTRSFESLAQSFFISPSAIAQYAALEVFEHQDMLQDTVTEYARNRDLLKTTLETLGFKGLNKAKGAFYLYANVTDFHCHSRDFCKNMLHDAYVCAVPGTDFDEMRGKDYVRFSFCGSYDDIAEACKRLTAWLGTGVSQKS